MDTVYKIRLDPLIGHIKDNWDGRVALNYQEVIPLEIAIQAHDIMEQRCYRAFDEQSRSYLVLFRECTWWITNRNELFASAPSESRTREQVPRTEVVETAERIIASGTASVGTAFVCKVQGLGITPMPRPTG